MATLSVMVWMYLQNSCVGNLILNKGVLEGAGYWEWFGFWDQHTWGYSNSDVRKSYENMECHKVELVNTCGSQLGKISESASFWTFWKPIVQAWAWTPFSCQPVIGQREILPEPWSGTKFVLSGDNGDRRKQPTLTNQGLQHLWPQCKSQEQEPTTKNLLRPNKDFPDLPRPHIYNCKGNSEETLWITFYLF